MPEKILINIEFRIKAGFVIPEVVRASLNSEIEWNLTDMSVFQSSRRFSDNGLKFELYFQRRSPFNWMSKSVNFRYQQFPDFGGLEPAVQPQSRVLASGVALEEGEYKYGIKVSEIDNDDTIYDDDPFIIIY